MKICVTPNANNINTKNVIFKNLQNDGGVYYIFYIILEILLWNNNTYLAQDTKLK